MRGARVLGQLSERQAPNKDKDKDKDEDEDEDEEKHMVISGV